MFAPLIASVLPPRPCPRPGCTNAGRDGWGGPDACGGAATPCAAERPASGAAIADRAAAFRTLYDGALPSGEEPETVDEKQKDPDFIQDFTLFTTVALPYSVPHVAWPAGNPEEMGTAGTEPTPSPEPVLAAEPETAKEILSTEGPDAPSLPPLPVREIRDPAERSRGDVAFALRLTPPAATPARGTAAPSPSKEVVEQRQPEMAGTRLPAAGEQPSGQAMDAGSSPNELQPGLPLACLKTAGRTLPAGARGPAPEAVITATDRAPVINEPLAPAENAAGESGALRNLLSTRAPDEAAGTTAREDGAAPAESGAPQKPSAAAVRGQGKAAAETGAAGKPVPADESRAEPFPIRLAGTPARAPVVSPNSDPPGRNDRSRVPTAPEDVHVEWPESAGPRTMGTGQRPAATDHPLEEAPEAGPRLDAEAARAATPPAAHKEPPATEPGAAPQRAAALPAEPLSRVPEAEQREASRQAGGHYAAGKELQAMEPQPDSRAPMAEAPRSGVAPDAALTHSDIRTDATGGRPGKPPTHPEARESGPADTEKVQSRNPGAAEPPVRAEGQATAAAPTAAVSAAPHTEAHRPAPPAAQPELPPEPAAPARPPKNPPATGAGAREISLRLTGEARDKVELRLVERAGQVHVSVRTPDRELASTLREGLKELVTQLESAGYRAERPDFHGAAGETGYGASDGSRREQAQEQPPQQQPQPRRQDHPGTQGGKEKFGSYLQERGTKDDSIR